MPQQHNEHTANATNPEEEVGRQLRRIDLLLVHRRSFSLSEGILISGARSRAVQSFGSQILHDENNQQNHNDRAD
jgi:hypothetical protein